MTAPATKNVTGVIAGLSADVLAGASLLFDLDPQYVTVGDNALIVGEQNAGTKGVSVAVGADGSFTVPIVAVDNPTWDIVVTLTGPNVETPVSFKMVPPPASGTGDVTFVPLMRDPTTGTPPVSITSLAGLTDVKLTSPTNGQGLVWNATDSKWENGAVSGGTGAVTSVNGHTGVVNLTNTDVGALSATDPSVTNARTPTAHASTHASGGSDAVTPASIGAITGSDSRLSDARTPLPHASTHAASGSDPLSLAALGGLALRTWRRRDIQPVVGDALYSGAAPTITTTQQSTSTISGAQALIMPDTGPFNYQGATEFQYGTGTPWSSYYSAKSKIPHTYTPNTAWAQIVWAVEFGCDAQLLEIKFAAADATNIAIQVCVDGQKLTDLPQNPGTWGGITLSAGYSNVIKIDLGAAAGAKPRKWRIQFFNCPFGGVFLPANATIWKTPSRGGRLIGFGDSLTDGSGGNSGQGMGTWLYRCARMLGVTDVWDQAKGGTGYVNPGTSDTLPNRVANDVVQYAPDRVICWAGYNDQPQYTTQQISTAANQTFAAIKAGSSNPDLIVIGCYSPTGSSSGSTGQTDAALLACATAANSPFISPVSGNIYDASGNVLDTPGPWITAANAATYVIQSGANSPHPNDAGHAYLARRIAEAITTLYSA